MLHREQNWRSARLLHTPGDIEVPSSIAFRISGLRASVARRRWVRPAPEPRRYGRTRPSQYPGRCFQGAGVGDHPRAADTTC
jgi:hypothetical protein